MSIHFRTVVPNAAHIRNLYFGQNENQNNSSRQSPDRREHDSRSLGNFNRHDTLTISAEAQRMQRLSAMTNIHDATLGQQREIYRPGLEQTEIRSQAGTEEASESNSEIIRRNEMMESMQQEQPRLSEEAGVWDAPARSEQAGQEGQPPREETSFGEAERRARSSEDMRSVEANINSFNSSSLVQAYATAANVTQASFTINYKV